jgi:hypothetical protein
MNAVSLTAAGFAATLALSASAQVIIPPEDAVKPYIELFPGNGLNGSIWFGTAASIADADGIVADGPRDGGLISSQVDYPNGPAGVVAVNQPLADFLGVDTPSAFGFDPLAVDSASKVFVFSGIIAIPASGDYLFGVASDDGMRLSIGSQVVTWFDGDRAFGLSTETASFAQAGYYRINLLYWANAGGESGVELLWNAGAGDLVVIPQASLYAMDNIPSPGSIALLGVAGVALVRRRR